MRPLTVWIVCILFPALALAQTTSSAGPDEELLRDLFRAVDLKFEAGDNVLQPYSLAVLDAVAAVLTRYPQLRLQIAGHTDANGSAESNQILSENRARTVKSFLVARYAIDPERLEIAGFGEALPIASNRTLAGRALNRRVEFRVIRGTRRIEPAPRPVDLDSVRLALERDIEQALRNEVPEVPEPDTTRLHELRARVAALAAEVEEMPPAREVSRFALLPFTGFYLREDLPILVGLRADLPTTLLGSARFQPELAVAFRPDESVFTFGANLALPISIGSHSAFMGAGVGFHDLDGFESVLNIFAGGEAQLGIGRLFAEIMTQDFFDFNRLIVGYRQEF